VAVLTETVVFSWRALNIYNLHSSRVDSVTRPETRQLAAPWHYFSTRARSPLANAMTR
jgi:hypothetical protein